VTEPIGPSSCPARERLDAYALGALDEESTGNIRRHLESCDACRVILAEVEADQELLGELADVFSETSASHEAHQTGDSAANLDTTEPLRGLIPGCDLLAEIHRGAQGVVYEAYQPVTKRRVAVKLLLTGAFSTELQRARFRREVELVASLDHPAIVTVFDSGRTPTGQPYLVMEHVKGAPLDVWSDSIFQNTATGNSFAVSSAIGASRKRLAPLLHVFIELADAVHAAHQRGIIHRDLKPSNVLVDDQHRPKVLDFGIAKLDTTGATTTSTDVDQATGSPNTFTQAGEFVGTIAYAAPEQVDPSIGATDIRADVYALGLLLYRALVGRHARDLAAPMPRLLVSIAGVMPEPPSRALARAGSDTTSATPMPDGPASASSSRVGLHINDELDAIVLRALAIEPARRYESAAALRDDLRRYLEGRAVSAKRDSRWYIARTFVRRHRVAVAASALGVVTLIGLVIGLAIALDASRTSNARRLALLEALVAVFEQADDNQRTAPGQASRVAMLADVLPDVAPIVEAALAADPLAAAHAGAGLARALIGQGMTERAHQLVNRVLPDAERKLGKDHPAVIELLDASGMTLWHTRRYSDAIEPFTQAHHRSVRRFGEHDHRTAVAAQRLGSCLMQTGQLNDAVVMLAQAAHVLESVGTDHERAPEALHAYALCLRQLGRIDEAADVQRRALERVERLFGPENWRAQPVLSALVAYLTALQAWDEAEQAIERAIDIDHRTSGQADANTAWLHTRLAGLLLARYEAHVAGRRNGVGGGVAVGSNSGAEGEPSAWLAEAVLRAAEGVEIRRAVIARGGAAADLDSALVTFARALSLSGRPHEAVEALEEARAMRRTSLGEGHWLVASCASQLGEALIDAGRHEEGKTLLRESHDILHSQLGPEHDITRAARARLERAVGPEIHNSAEQQPAAGRVPVE